MLTNEQIAKNANKIPQPNRQAATRRRCSCAEEDDKTQKRKNFWDQYAKYYNRFLSRDTAAYEQLAEWLRPVVRQKAVLELAAGTGQLAKQLVSAAGSIEATDASAAMIAQARRENDSAKLHFSVQDMFCLPYADASFDVVIVSNALHVVPHPEQALREIRRVLKDDGVLAAPTFTHGENRIWENAKALLMKRAGFPLYSRWTSRGYLDFLQSNGWAVRKRAVVKAAFPLTYAECVKAKKP